MLPFFEGCLTSGRSGRFSCLFACSAFRLGVFRVVEKPWESLGSLTRRVCAGIGADSGLFYLRVAVNLPGTGS